MVLSVSLVISLGEERATDYLLIGFTFYTLPQGLMHFIAGLSASLIAIKVRLVHAAITGLVMTSAQVLIEAVFLDEELSLPIEMSALYILVGTVVASFGGFAGRPIPAVLSRRDRAADEHSRWDYELLTGETISVQSSRRRPIKALMISCAGVLAIFVGAGLFLLDISRSKIDRGTITGTGMLVTIGIGCFLRAKRMLAKPFHDVIKVDDQSPVIYLRSFEDDEEHGAPDAGLQMFFGLSVYKNTAEDIIVDSFKRLGPVIAVGKPGESLPIPGATRLYVSHEHWQAVVSDLMQRAAAVVLRAGTSTGLSWEIKHALQNVAPDRVCIVLVPPTGYTKDQKKHYENVGAALEKSAGVSLPDGTVGAKVLVCDTKQNLAKWRPSVSHPLDAYIRNIDSDPVFNPTTMFGFKDQKPLLILLGILVLVFIAIVLFWQFH